MARKVYISGKMRGLPGFNYRRFFDVEAELKRTHGWDVVNPARLSEKFGTPDAINDSADLLKRVLEYDLQQVSECDAIYLLNGWETSGGAKLELKKALECGLDVILEG